MIYRYSKHRFGCVIFFDGSVCHTRPSGFDKGSNFGDFFLKKTSSRGMSSLKVSGKYEI